MKKETFCLIKNCGKHDYIRGLCQNCYASARHIVQVGKTTWEKLEKIKLALPLKTTSFMTEYRKQTK